MARWDLNVQSAVERVCTTQCLAVAMNKHKTCLNKGCFLPCLGQGSSLWQHAGMQFFFMLWTWAESNASHSAVWATSLENGKSPFIHQACVHQIALSSRTQIQSEFQERPLREPSPSRSPLLCWQVKLYGEVPSSSEKRQTVIFTYFKEHFCLSSLPAFIFAQHCFRDSDTALSSIILHLMCKSIIMLGLVWKQSGCTM